MSSATFERGPITFPVAKDVTRRRLVKLGENGVEHAGASDDAFGAVTDSGIVSGSRVGVNNLVAGPDSNVAVHISPAAVKLEISGDASGFKMGTTVFTAADGKVAVTGTKPAGVVVRTPNKGFVVVALTVPAPKGE